MHRYPNHAGLKNIHTNILNISLFGTRMHKKPRRVVGCLIEYDQRFLTLLRRPDDGDCWGLPAGGVNQGETDGQAMIREIKEETGYHAEATSLEYLGEWQWEFPEYPIRFIAFRLRLSKPILVKHNPDEHVRFEWVTPLELIAKPNLISGFRELLEKIGYLENQ